MNKLLLALCFLALPVFGADNPMLRNYFDTNSAAALKVYDIRSFGAKADGTMVRDAQVAASGTALTSIQASWTAADVGKVVSIPFAHSAGGVVSNLTTTIAAFVSSTNVTLTTAARNGATNVTIIYGTDDTTPVQLCINTLLSNRISARVMLPGLCIINGGFQDVGTWTNNNNAQLIFPPITPIGTMGPTIEFDGQVEPMGNGSGITAFVGTNDWSVVGGGLWSTIMRAPDDGNRYSLMDARNFVTPAAHAVGIFPSFMNGIRVNFVNCIIGGSFNGNISLLNLMGAMNAKIDGCVVYTGNLISQAPYSTGTNGYAITLPGLFNDFHAVCRDTRVGTGFYTGIDLCDSATVENVLVMGCSNAFTTVNGTANPISVRNVIAQDCANIFFCGPVYTFANVHDLTIMDNYGSFQYLLNDPGNALRGTIHITRFIGSTDTAPPILGGNKCRVVFDPHTINRTVIYNTSTEFREGKGDAFGVFGALRFGADYGTNTVTSAVRKWGAINTDNYSNSLVTPIVWDAFNNGNSYLYLGGYSANAGATEIRFAASGGNIAAQPNLLFRITGTGLIEPFGASGTACSLGSATIGFTTVACTNLNWFTTNTAPVSIVAPTKWKSVTIEGTTYKIPLYQ